MQWGNVSRRFFARVPTWRYARVTMNTVAYASTFNARQLVSDIVILVSRLGVLMLLYAHVASVKGGTIGGMPVEAIVWTSFLYFSVYAFGLRWTARVIERDVKSGNIEMHLSRPVSYMWYRLFSKLGGMTTPFLGTVGGGALLLVSFFGIPYFLFSFVTFFSIIVTLVLGFFLGFFMNMCIGFTAFWIEDIQPVQNLFEKMAMILGGAYIPVALFPEWLQAVATYTPFGLAYATTRVVSPTWQSEWALVLCAQCAWVVAGFFLMQYMYARVVKRVSVNGG